MTERCVTCITCGEKIPKERTELYQEQKYFEDLCYCNKCIAIAYFPMLRTAPDYGI